MHSRHTALRQQDGEGPSYHTVVYWAPRALTIAFAIFLGLFALDVFSEHLSAGQLLVALAMHLVPSIVLVVLLAISWKWEWVGISFIALGLYYYIWLAHERHVALALVAFAIGSLFLVNWFLRSDSRG